MRTVVYVIGYCAIHLAVGVAVLAGSVAVLGL